MTAATNRPVLYDYWRSSAAYRVRIGLALKGIAHETASIDLVAGEQRGADHLARNPQGFVPALRIDGHLLTQSLSILVYLDQTRPEPRLVPADPADGAHVRAMALLVATDIHPLNNLRVLKALESDFGADADTKTRWMQRWMADGFAALEALAAPRAGSFLFGNTPTLADICLVPQLYNARRFELDLAPYPVLRRAEASACAHPAFAAAHPDNAKEAAR
jgi:maleylacetoacetate isomerase